MHGKSASQLLSLIQRVRDPAKHSARVITLAETPLGIELVYINTMGPLVERVPQGRRPPCPLCLVMGSGRCMMLGGQFLTRHSN